MVAESIRAPAPKGAGDDRLKVGRRAGVVGVFVNLLLGASKLLAGLAIDSLAVIADGVNNLSDSFSSLITLFSFEWAGRPADREHPFGHGRVEYIAALTLAFMVSAVGLQFVKSSVLRIFHPVRLPFVSWALALMLGSIAIKAGLGAYYTTMNRRIQSGTLKAAALDSFSDVAVTSCVALSLLLPRYTALPLDGYIGLAVALLILYSGYRIIQGTLTPLLGATPDPELVRSIRAVILSHPPIQGVHDLIVHSYGPGKCFASAHAEVPAGLSATELHEAIDHVERELEEAFQVSVVLHMDPVNPDSAELNAAREELADILCGFPEVVSMHDLRVVGRGDHKKVLFDVVLACSCQLSGAARERLIQGIDRGIKKRHPYYTTTITVDREMAEG